MKWKSILRVILIVISIALIYVIYLGKSRDPFQVVLQDNTGESRVLEDKSR